MGEGSADDGDLIVGHVVGVTVGPDRQHDAAIACDCRGDRRSGRDPDRTQPAYGVINGLRKGRRDEDRPAVDIQLLGEAMRTAHGPAFQRGVTAYPPLDAPILAVTPVETAAVYAPPAVANIEIGCLRHDEALPAYLATDQLLGKNFAILGSTGSGKSCAVTVVLRSCSSAILARTS